uniref:Uncharacterized protein n=1 Tax=Cannabis sativa TaxID=3483 RepID=A0A803QRI5_CANSA
CSPASLVVWVHDLVLHKFQSQLGSQGRSQVSGSKFGSSSVLVLVSVLHLDTNHWFCSSLLLLIPKSRSFITAMGLWPVFGSRPVSHFEVLVRSRH